MQFKFKQFKTDIKTKRTIVGNYSLDDIAMATKVSKATLSRLENGGMPTLLHYASVCKWLGVSTDKYLSK